MSDANSSLPIRTENNGDVKAILVDGTITSQALAIDAAGKVSVKLDDAAGTGLTSQVNGTQQALDVGINVAGVQVDPRDTRALTATDVVTSNQGSANTLANAWPVKPTDGTNSQSFTATGEAKVEVTQPLPAGTNTIGAVTQASGPWTQNLTQVGGSSIALGQTTMAASLPVTLASNQGPIAVSISSDGVGTEIDAYNTASAVAAGANSNHDYTVTAGKTLQLTQIEASASGKLKIEVQVETGVGAGTFTTKFVQFNSTANPNCSLKIGPAISVAAGVKVRIIRTNKDNQVQDLYSTICGQEI
jgi:hypothetical protein